MKSIVAAFSLLRQVHSEKGEWQPLLDLFETVLDRMGASEDKLYLAIQAGGIAFNQLNDIASDDALQTAEKAISMSRDSQVAGFADAGGSENASHSAIQGEIIGIIEDRHLKLNLGNTENAKRKIGLLREAVFVRSDPLGRP